LWLEQLALDPWARGLVWQEPPPAQDLGKFTVAVIGEDLPDGADWYRWRHTSC
jgi:4-hydroxyacetophenone monooxygenase